MRRPPFHSMNIRCNTLESLYPASSPRHPARQVRRPYEHLSAISSIPSLQFPNLSQLALGYFSETLLPFRFSLLSSFQQFGVVEAFPSEFYFPCHFLNFIRKVHNNSYNWWPCRHRTDCPWRSAIRHSAQHLELSDIYRRW